MALRVNGIFYKDCSYKILGTTLVKIRKQDPDKITYLKAKARHGNYPEDSLYSAYLHNPHNVKFVDKIELPMDKVSGIQWVNRDKKVALLQINITQVYANNSLVWQYGCKPKQITDFRCSEDLYEHIRITFTEPTGVTPPPRYDLYEQDTLLKQAVYSGFELPVWDDGFHYLHIRAVNENGTVLSNTCRGKALQDAIQYKVENFDATTDRIEEIQVTFDEFKEPNWIYSLVRASDRSVIAPDIRSGYIWQTKNKGIWLAIMAQNGSDMVFSKGDKGMSLWAPSTITDFRASKDRQGEIKINFSPADGNGEPWYELLDADTNEVLATSVRDGYIYRTQKESYRLRVKAKNGQGYSLSNIDEGRTREASGAAIYTVSGSFKVPRGYSRVYVCMIGGGGGGASSDFVSGNKNFQFAGGGFAGKEFSGYVDVTSGEVIQVTVGQGGKGYKPPTGDDAAGSNGTDSIFKSAVAKGGSGGDSTGYYGAGDPVKGGCGAGGFRDGKEMPSDCIVAYGGQGSSFGSGGDGVVNENIKPPTAGVGAGGAGAVSCLSGKDPHGGDGGRGEVRIYWGSDEEIERMLTKN